MLVLLDADELCMYHGILKQKSKVDDRFMSIVGIVSLVFSFISLRDNCVILFSYSLVYQRVCVIFSKPINVNLYAVIF